MIGHNEKANKNSKIALSKWKILLLTPVFNARRFRPIGIDTGNNPNKDKNILINPKLISSIVFELRLLILT